MKKYIIINEKKYKVKKFKDGNYWLIEDYLGKKISWKQALKIKVEGCHLPSEEEADNLIDRYSLAQLRIETGAIEKFISFIWKAKTADDHFWLSDVINDEEFPAKVFVLTGPNLISTPGTTRDAEAYVRLIVDDLSLIFEEKEGEK